MANYWYVSSVAGTASTATARVTTDITVQRTGAFSSMAAGDHFPSITDAMAGDASGTPVAGDYIFVADDHSATSASGRTLGPAAAIDTPVMIISVAEANCDQYSSGAAEAVTGGSTSFVVSSTPGSKATISGVNLTTDDDISTTTSQQLTIKDATLRFTASGDLLRPTGFANTLEILDSN